MQYYSTELKKLFDSITDLEEAEKAFKEDNEKKLAEKEARKAEAKVVEDAYTALADAKKERARVLTEALDEYKQACKTAKEKYLAVKDAQDAIVKSAAEARDTALKEFTDKHKEGFHLTLKDPDGATTTISTNTYRNIEPEFSDLFKEFDSLWTSIFRNWF